MISIIVPVFNSEKGIDRCIKSILSQTYSDLELILIDDGSSDRSAGICKQYEKKDPRVHLVQQENRGVSAARNRGLALAKGEYLQFVDSDDYIACSMCEKLVTHIEKSGADVVICGHTELLGDVKDVRLPRIEGKVYLKELRQIYPEIFEKFILNSPCNKLYRKCKLIEDFPEDISLGEDLIFNLHNLKNMESVFFLKESLYFYVTHSESLNRKYRKDSIECAECLYLESMNFSKHFQLGERAEKDISTIFITFLFYGLSDVYSISNYATKSKAAILKKWILNPYVQQAATVAEVGPFYRKLALFMTKHKIIWGLKGLFIVRSKLR